jgi:hypothetical protein
MRNKDSTLRREIDEKYAAGFERILLENFTRIVWENVN